MFLVPRKQIDIEEIR